MSTQPEKRPHRYRASFANEIEERWQAWWEEEQVYRQPNPGDPDFDAAKPRFYVLDMFPYPSGAGLHVGHPEGYTATDIIARYMRMRGYNVLHPMGWDAFGLPAEQYSIETGVHPAKTTLESMDNFRRQLKRFGFCYDWSREFATIDPDYFRWTQWIFLEIYNAWFDPIRNKARPIAELIDGLEKGHVGVGVDNEIVDLRRHEAFDAFESLPPDVIPYKELTPERLREFVDSKRLAYVDEQTVNWCPRLGTALSNEEVINGRSERGGHVVLRKPLKQWLFRITAYADRLLEDLDGLHWPESTKVMQTEWIGRSTGADMDFELVDCPMPYLRVYTTRPDTVFGATYMVVAPEHPLLDHVEDAGVREYVEEARHRSDLERQESKQKTGVFTGIHAINPATGEKIPVWCADYVLMGYGHGAIMAVPGQDQRDWDFAKEFGLPIVRTVQPPDDFDGEAYVGEGPAINSGFLDGLGVEEAIARTIEWLEEEDRGRARVNFKLRDWLFSRQRYWGEPFPIVWDEQGNHHGVGEDTLPVELPDMEDFAPEESEEPQPMLAKAREWVRTTAGEAGVAELPPDAKVFRETNTMPGWAGSCWYYLRFCDPKNSERLIGREAESYWMGERGVDLYIGGAEHAVLHLLYARFWHKVLYDLGEIASPEPFRRLFHQGMVTSFAYERPDGSLVPIDEVDEVAEDRHVERATGQEVKQVVAKMSKSLRNVTSPDDVIAEYGADTFRLYEMYMGALEDSAPWNTRDTVGLYRFLQRAWRMVVDEETGALRFAGTADAAIEKKLHRTTVKVGSDVERLAFNTAIAAMIEFVNAAGNGGLTRGQAEHFVRVLAPFAPHMAEELWHRMGHEDTITRAAWPAADEAMLADDVVEVVVQILGKVRSRVQVPAGADDAAHEQAALADERIAKLLEGKTVRKVIVVPGRIVNIVAN